MNGQKLGDKCPKGGKNIFNNFRISIITSQKSVNKEIHKKEIIYT